VLNLKIKLDIDQSKMLSDLFIENGLTLYEKNKF
jgi:hypothetical protein